MVYAGLIGLFVGSFLNVVIWRVPRGESVVSPRSACPVCGRQIRVRDNVPVVSWLLLRARCRDCGEPISARYPLVELATGMAFALVVLRFGVAWPLPAYVYLSAVAIALSLIDIDVHRLPNAIVLPSYPVMVVLLALASANPGGTSDWPALLRAVLGGAALFALYFALMVAKPGGMGFGDVKLAGILGGALGWLGWGTLVVGAFGAFVVGGVFSIGLLAAGRAGRKSRIPFGPWMILGAALGVALGERVWTGYLALFM